MIDNRTPNRGKTDRDTEEIAPLVPMLEQTETTQADTPARKPKARRPPRTDYTADYDRATELIEPLVPDLR